MRRCLSTFKERGLIEEEPSINLTPLIDVVFVILIMFIVVAPLLNFENIELAEANAQDSAHSHSVASSSPVSIRVSSDNSVMLNDERIAMQELPQQLKKLRAQFPQATPQLFHDKRAFFGTYHNVKNAAEEAGYGTMDLILAPQ